jgi:hypothetical protein
MIESIIYQLGLEQLIRKNGKFNFRCPICKDSKTNLKKKRGWIYQNKKGVWRYRCYNCFKSNSLKYFLKENYPHLYLEYLKEISFNSDEPAKIKTEDHSNEAPRIELERITDLPSILELDENHFARKYLVKRKISLKHFNHIYFTYNYQSWINTKIPNKFESTPAYDPRIVLPIYNIHKKIVGVQGRAIDKSKLRYITILFNDNELNVSGLEKIDRTKTIYITEGYIDSLFLDNAISMNSANVETDRLLEIANKELFVFIYDNERRNKEIKERMLSVARKGFKIVLWPSYVYSWGKDINKMIENGVIVEKIKEIIEGNIFQGFLAESKIRMM